MQEKHTSILKLGRNLILYSLLGAVFALVADVPTVYPVTSGFIFGFLISLPPEAIHFLKSVCGHWKVLITVVLFLLGESTLAFLVGICFIGWETFGGVIRLIAIVILLLVAAGLYFTIFS